MCSLRGFERLGFPGLDKGTNRAYINAMQSDSGNAVAGFSPPKKRSRMMVMMGLQAGIVAIMMGFVMVATGLVLFDYYYYFGRTRVNNLMDPVHIAGFLLANPALIAKLVIFFCFAAGAAVLLSHRIAGPLYRLEKTLLAAGRGDLRGHMKLRVGDALGDLAVSYNRAVEELRGHIADDRSRVNQLLALVAALRARPESAPMRAELESLELELRSLTRHFQI